MFQAVLGENAISAVQSTGIASGTGEGKFEPSKTVTREQYAQFLYNTLKYKTRSCGARYRGCSTISSI